MSVGSYSEILAVLRLSDAVFPVSFCIYLPARAGGERGKHTSRRKIKSLTTLIILPIVASNPPSSLSGRAKLIVWPFLNNPLESNWLLIYSDAVLRLSGSILVSQGSREQGLWCRVKVRRVDYLYCHVCI